MFDFQNSHSVDLHLFRGVLGEDFLGQFDMLIDNAQTLLCVIAVYTAEDLGDYWKPGPLLVPPPPIAGIIFNQRTQVPLAKDKVRHVGEPLVIVIAESRYIAEDALDDIEVEHRAAAGGGRSRSRAARRDRRWSTTTSAPTSPPMSTRPRATMPQAAAKADCM